MVTISLLPKSQEEAHPPSITAMSEGMRHHIPGVVFEHIDKYVDSLAPQIQPQMEQEMDTFQQKTIDSLDDKIVDAFRSLFNKDKSDRPLDGSRSLDQTPPDSYGIQSLPFADELASFSRSFSKIADDANDDLLSIFNLTEGGGGGGRREESSRGLGQGDSFREGARGFLSAAIDAVAEHAGKPGGGGGSGGEKLVLDGLLGVLSDRVKEATRNPEEKARVISPEIKEKVGAILRQQHAPIAEQFTRVALDHIKKWLRGNTSTRDLGDGLKGEISDMVSNFAGMFGHKKKSEENARSVDRDGGDGDSGSSSGFSGVISSKLSTGLAKVHREVRIEFRKILGGIEKNLFEALPDEFQGPLEKILGGNPFDEQLTSQKQHSSSRGFSDDIKAKLVDKIRRLVRKVQESLRESVLSIVNGGHRKFEMASWMFVQEKVELKVRKFLPDVRITVPDDIGNEGVSVGAPETKPGMSHQPSAPPQQHGDRPPSQGQGQYYGGPPPPQSYDHNQGQQYGQQQDYGQNQQYGQSQGYGQAQAYHQNQPLYGQSQGYGNDQGNNRY